MDLKDMIIDRLNGGLMSFRDFMDTALYYPQLGYYCHTGEIHQSTDYLTSPVITPLFGRLIAKQLEEVWLLMGTKNFTIVEYGAGSAILCSDILHELSANKKIYEQLTYYIIEKNTDSARSIHASFPGKVKYVQRIEEVPREDVCILSNELVDNFPVHIIVKEKKYQEIFVGYRNDFFETPRPVNGEITEYLDEAVCDVKEGEKKAVNLEAKKWIQDIGRWLQKGVVITIDYGYTTDNTPKHNKEDAVHPIACYYRHRRHFNPYINIGEQDITARVDFSALRYWGEKTGLLFSALVPQKLFLSALGFTEALRKAETHEKLQQGFMASFFLNEFILQMGRNIKIMLQYKGLSRPQLKGFSLL